MAAQADCAMDQDSPSGEDIKSNWPRCPNRHRTVYFPPPELGKCTSSIWIVANLSNTARGVSPGASGRNRARRVMCRQEWHEDVQTVSHEGHKDVFNSMLQLVKNGTQAKSSLRFLKAASISTNWM